MLIAGLAQPADAAKKHKKHKPAPHRSLTSTDSPDPSVVRLKSGFTVISTGVRVPRLTSRNGTTFKAGGTALSRRPAWASGAGMWAADMVGYGGRWLLYFAAPVRGMKSSSHCIGVAVGTGPHSVFTPIDDRPLVCPPGADTPAAEDQYTDGLVTGKPNPANSHGAIDPSFTILGHRPYLLYKTDGVPSSIRLLPLSGDGAHAAGASVQLLLSGGVVENPVIVQKGKNWILFTSEGDYTTCSYTTVWRRSRNPFASWQQAPAHVLLSRPKQRLCGPGGADVVKSGKKTLMYFAAWTCRHSRQPCSRSLHATSTADAWKTPVRSLYGLRLAFTKKGYPRIDSWIKPAAAKKKR